MDVTATSGPQGDGLGDGWDDVPVAWRDLPVGEYAFPGELRDRLVSAIARGAKTSTTALLADYEHFADPLPEIGFREVVIDAQGAPVVVTEITSVRVCRLDEVTLEHALAEGEGHHSVEEWRAGHLRFWSSAQYQAEVGEVPLNDATPVVCVEFRVTERPGASPALD
ncbi:MAG: ASCH domain-containing protein [Propionibacteriaceae bacterium]|jgi:uncharacterized protein YhfF|nr:ASCH domain-containing protein [Micropruina sp.]HBX81110.1 RNA-binding protein [Propionibacteriaceae bacterium]